MLNKKLLTTLLGLMVAICAYSQEKNCNNIVKVSVRDAATMLPLDDAHITLGQQNRVTDTTGDVVFLFVCEGQGDIVVSHSDCETVREFITLSSDTTIDIFLNHNHVKLLNQAVVSGSKNNPNTQNSSEINARQIDQNQEQNLGSMLEAISGVSTIRNGVSISKPVVEGMYGNRLAILNNGIAQAGQNWGNDHAPEIDPLVANKVTVLKGAAALEYPGTNLGNVILVEPKNIELDPHMHGRSSAFFQSNGLGFGIHTELGQQISDKVGFKAGGTIKMNGDYSAPDYYLTNTASREGDFNLSINYRYCKNILNKFYFSSYNSNIGILKGSHISNLTDLQDAFTRDTPLYTSEDFSYLTRAPYQRVHHQLAKWETIVTHSDKTVMHYTAALQYNSRKEYDNRRGGRSLDPSLSLGLLNAYAEAKLTHNFCQNNLLKAGFQYSYLNNTNRSGTGILPLIPDYIAVDPAIYVTNLLRFPEVDVEYGGRIDMRFLDAVTISQTFPRTATRQNQTYLNLAVLAGIKQRNPDVITWAFNSGFKTRNPEVNELYSAGLHQGVSGLEFGDADLQSEKSFKNTFTVSYNPSEKFQLKANAYFQKIWDYIYLLPSGEYQLTIRGAFPVYYYRQTDASIYGTELDMHWGILDMLHLDASGSFLEGRDNTAKQGLVYIPSSNLNTSLNYHYHPCGPWDDLEIHLLNSTVFAKTGIAESQDFLAPPPTYSLWGLAIYSGLESLTTHMRFNLKIDNIFNVRYRDYMNRQRYFADAMGRNIVLGVSFLY